MAVHRYKAGQEGKVEETSPKPKKTVSKKVTKTKAEPAVVTEKKALKAEKKANKKPSFLGRIKEYFVGSWHELRQVRWPNRKQTWSLTLAVIIFSLGMGGLIFLLDLGFTYLFKNIIF